MLAPTTKEVNQEILIVGLNGRINTLESDKVSLGALVSSKNSQITRLEAENLRLKMTRTDKELAVQVEGLRFEVGKKDRESVDLKRKLETFQDNEKIILRRAVAAEQKIVVMQNTMMTMQRGRDAAYLEVEKHDRERLESVRHMVDATDRAKKAEERIKEFEKKPKGPEAPKAAKK